MLDKNQEVVVDYLKSIIESIEEGSAEIDSLDNTEDWIEHYTEDGLGCSVIDGRFLTGKGTITLHYNAKKMPKKEYKTQQEIYEELVSEKYVSMYRLCGRISKSTREANIYAVQNTQRVWREQYEVH